AVALVPLARPSPSQAWGGRAHRIATRVAEERLTPAARAAVRDLLNKGDTLVSIADWADGPGFEVVPRSAPWHYVNVPLTARDQPAQHVGLGPPERGRGQRPRLARADREPADPRERGGVVEGRRRPVGRREPPGGQEGIRLPPRRRPPDRERGHARRGVRGV